MNHSATSPVLNAVLGLLLASLPGLGLAHDGKLPVADGNLSRSAKVRFIYSCQQSFDANAGGAHYAGDWIKGDFWYPALKPVVEGAVTWSGGGVTMTKSGSTRKILSNGLPTHTTGIYPIRSSDAAAQYDRNPNAIRTQSVSLNLPANPKIASKPSCLGMGPIGIALTGVAIYNALDSGGWDGVMHEIQDSCGGHPQRRGQYHYHGPSDCMIEGDSGVNGHSGLIGYAMDGFGIYGLNGADGKHMTNANLDACHGHTEAVVWDGKSRKIYHYHLTDEYPYTLGCYSGTAISRTQMGGDQNRKTGLDNGQNRTGNILTIAAQDLGVTVADLRRALGGRPPNFTAAARALGMSSSRIRTAMRKARRQARN